MTRVEEERIQVLNNMDKLEQKIKELDNQMDESLREVRRDGGGRDRDIGGGREERREGEM